MREFGILITLLAETGIPFVESAWITDGQRRTPAPPYGVYALEGSGGDLWGDDQLQEQVLRGTVDLFTADQGRAQKIQVENAFRETGVCWQLNSIQYEPDTGLTHHEWLFEAI